MQGQKVVVFGGGGLLGRQVVQALARQGALVTAAVRRPEMVGHLRTMGEVGQITPVFCDIKDSDGTDNILKSAHAAINLVGVLFEKKRQTFKNVHVMGAKNVALSATKNNVPHLVHISSLVDKGFSELSHYASTKLKGEQEVVKAFPSATILRPSLIYGPNEKFFSLYARLLSMSPFVPLFGGGKTKFQPVFAVDIAKAILACLQAPQKKSTFYELGGPEVYTFKELIQKVADCINRKVTFIDLPYSVANMLATPLSLLPTPLLTRDQVRMMRSDSICSSKDDSVGSFSDLGIVPEPLDLHLPSLLRACQACF